MVKAPANTILRLLSGEPVAAPPAEVDSEEELIAPVNTMSTPSEDMFAAAARTLLDPLPPGLLVAVPARPMATWPEPGDLVVAMLAESEVELVAVPTRATPTEEPVVTAAVTVPSAVLAEPALAAPRVSMAAETVVAWCVPSPPANAAEVAPDTSRTF